MFGGTDIAVDNMNVVRLAKVFIKQNQMADVTIRHIIISSGLKCEIISDTL